MDQPEPKPKLAGARWRLPTAGLVLSLFVAYATYRGLHDGGLEQSALFYVGLPAVIAVTVALTARPRSEIGASVVAITIGLLLAGPLLGEGIVCLLFAAPLFYLVAVMIGAIVKSCRERQQRALAGIVLIPVLLMTIEGTGPATTLPRENTAVSERSVHAPATAVEAALASTPVYERPASPFLRLGFPRPVSATGDGLEVGDERFVTFTPRRSLGLGAEPTPRSMRLRVTERQPGKVIFAIVQDSTAARWLDLHTVEVTWRPNAAKNTTVRWTLHYRRTFDPSWYFGPLQRYGMERVADYLNENITRPHDDA